MTRKHNVHCFSSRRIAERRIRCRLLHEKHLFREKIENVVTIEETWVYLHYCNKRDSFTTLKEEKKIINASKENFNK